MKSRSLLAVLLAVSMFGMSNVSYAAGTQLKPLLKKIDPSLAKTDTPTPPAASAPPPSPNPLGKITGSPVSPPPKRAVTPPSPVQAAAPPAIPPANQTQPAYPP